MPFSTRFASLPSCTTQVQQPIFQARRSLNSHVPSHPPSPTTPTCCSTNLNLSVSLSKLSSLQSHLSLSLSHPLKFSLRPYPPHLNFHLSFKPPKKFTILKHRLGQRYCFSMLLLLSQYYFIIVICKALGIYSYSVLS